MSLSSAIMLLKLLQTSIKHEEKAQQVKEQYEDGFKFCGGDESLKDKDSRGRPNILQNEDLRLEPYSPDLFQTDYHFFKHLDKFLSNQSFRIKEEVESAFMDFLASKSQDFFDVA